MKICPKCKNEHSATGIYCTRKCANSRVFTEEARKKKSKSNKRYWKGLSGATKEEKIKVATDAWSGRYIDRLLTQDWMVLGIQGKRKRVILEQEGKCNRCGITDWNGIPITLEYEHKDGNTDNNDRNNVECLCPNCHSQTPTWRGRKNGGRQKRVENLIRML